MITDISLKVEKGRVYADIKQDSIVEGEKVEVEISNTDNDYYHSKYLPKALSTKLDLTPYCKAYLNGKLSEVLSSDTHRAFNHKLSVWVRIPEIAHLTGAYGGYDMVMGLLTRLPYLQISKGADGDADPIRVAVRIYDEGEHILESDRVQLEIREGDFDVLFCNVAGEHYVKIVSTLYSPQDFFRSEIPIRTVMRGMNTRRLIWRNELGGIDAWSFEFLRENNYATTSEVFYSSTKGYTRTNRKSERLHTVETRELDDLTAEVVAYVIASPEVYLWDYENNTAIPIDIVTEECRTYSDTELSSIQVVYRLKERESV